MSNLVLNMSKTIIYDFPDLTPEGGGGVGKGSLFVLLYI